MEMEMEIRPKG